MSPTKIVKPQSKGMVTIPVEFRQKLNIDENSLLEVKLLSNGISFIKIDYKPDTTEIYSDEDIQIWLKEDKLDKKTAEKLAKLIKN
ncbi:MAG: AbrB/MazE/SpoVT family DNA-binding domain-containing protein [Patescibacteria group bacterium]|mgnify:CR=1 FL=1